jgi:hypothetical protein
MMMKRSRPQRSYGRPAAQLALVLLLAAALAGCAKRSDPAPPKGEPNTFPRAYPHD